MRARVALLHSHDPDLRFSLFLLIAPPTGSLCCSCSVSSRTRGRKKAASTPEPQAPAFMWRRDAASRPIISCRARGGATATGLDPVLGPLDTIPSLQYSQCSPTIFVHPGVRFVLWTVVHGSAAIAIVTGEALRYGMAEPVTDMLAYALTGMTMPMWISGLVFCRGRTHVIVAGLALYHYDNAI